MKKAKPGTLAGVNVLDFTWVLAGPHATKNLADMGANVMKIELFKKGTNERHQATQVEHNGVTQCSYHLNLNRGKEASASISSILRELKWSRIWPGKAILSSRTLRQAS